MPQLSHQGVGRVGHPHLSTALPRQPMNASAVVVIVVGTDDKTNVLHTPAEDILNVADNIFFAPHRHVSNKQPTVFLDDIAVGETTFYRVNIHHRAIL